ncbi:hypothetical protein TREES_T100007430 [Tupaia chinensis]|uniref:Uncharacterized protein n=1 Tax=Tupaia chinensis TaxID=246437 RepID=L9KZX8_TUPCH|nr:hypothetical protein TREES_T100007430 [Tupaia chinensis]
MTGFRSCHSEMNGDSEMNHGELPRRPSRALTPTRAIKRLSPSVVTAPTANESIGWETTAPGNSPWHTSTAQDSTGQQPTAHLHGAGTTAHGTPPRRGDNTPRHTATAQGQQPTAHRHGVGNSPQRGTAQRPTAS